MNSKIRPLVELNVATLVLGTSGVLSQLVSLPPQYTILFRGLLTALVLFGYLRFKGVSLKVDFKRDKWFFLFSGALLAAHWVSYFYAIEFSSVAVGFLAMFSFPVITALLEPLLLKEVKFAPANLLTALLVFVGLWQLVPEFSLDNDITLGVVTGVGSALFYALRNIWNKRHISKYDGGTIMFYQVLGTGFFLLPLLLIEVPTFEQHDFLYIALLSIGTTAIGHTMFVQSLRHFSTTTVSVMSCLQPIYGVIYAALILDEKVTSNIYLGGGIILSTVLLESIRNYFAGKKST